ncbi:hypothetical protein TL16_g10224 [Triparma laevis f. inornata]|uniref:Uncharacterized protein n=1 Tax=Triparma laevis f. inornata TaxID=1714386 RepID=A0A9W7BD06_9STRA|nr:hypothetical protein TL16_g10224 [Triparma laevis f. inornata]
MGVHIDVVFVKPGEEIVVGVAVVKDVDWAGWVVEFCGLGRVGGGSVRGGDAVLGFLCSYLDARHEHVLARFRRQLSVGVNDGDGVGPEHGGEGHAPAVVPL